MVNDMDTHAWITFTYFISIYANYLLHSFVCVIAWTCCFCCISSEDDGHKLFIHRIDKKTIELVWNDDFMFSHGFIAKPHWDRSGCYLVNLRTNRQNKVNIKCVMCLHNRQFPLDMILFWWKCEEIPCVIAILLLPLNWINLQFKVNERFKWRTPWWMCKIYLLL